MMDNLRSTNFCTGCGFHVEKEDVVECEEYSDRVRMCKQCKAEPRLRESYRRGFNAGLDALECAVIGIVRDSGLRKRLTGFGGDE